VPQFSLHNETTHSLIYFISKPSPFFSRLDNFIFRILQVIHQAMRCATQLHLIEESARTVDTVQLKLHIGIGAGKFRFVFVGGIFGRWEYMVTDCDDNEGPIYQIGIAESNAEPDETVIHRRAYEIIADDMAKSKPIFIDKDRVVPAAYKIEKLKKAEFDSKLQRMEVPDMDEDKVRRSRWLLFIMI
jgi:hypothetical protein